MLDWQDGRCAICGHGQKVRPARRHLDHDHWTGLVRGYLCPNCNISEGVNAYDYEHPTVWSYYRQRPPVLILGIEIRYYNPRTGGYDIGEAERERRMFGEGGWAGWQKRGRVFGNGQLSL